MAGSDDAGAAAPLADRFVGCLLGCAIGDALGMPAEGMSRREIEAAYGELRDFAPCPTGALGAGQYTDDTQMMLCIAEQIAEDGEFDPGATSRRFVKWYYDLPRRPGRACISACHRLIEGVPWQESGGREEAGCGAAMRVMPVGLRYLGDLTALRRAAAESAVITHRDSRAVAGAVAVAYAVALAASAAGGVEGGVFLGEVAEFVGAMNEDMGRAIARARSLLKADPAEALAALGTGGFVMEAVPAALYCFARSPGNASTPLRAGFEASVLLAANAGGDTDTVAAMAGAISGALNGAGSIPPRFCEHVEGAEHLRRVALKLYEQASGRA